MVNFTKCQAVRLTAIFLASSLVLSAGIALSARGQQPKANAEPSKLAKELIGTWILAGTPDKVTEPPKAGGRLKFITGKHWAVTQADADTGKVIFHHGGTYTLDGDTYAETVVYANESTAELIKKTFTFKVKVEGDTYTQVAMGDDNPFTEVWKRAK
jgi:hypothetical protein